MTGRQPGLPHPVVSDPAGPGCRVVPRAAIEDTVLPELCPRPAPDSASGTYWVRLTVYRV